MTAAILSVVKAATELLKKSSDSPALDAEVLLCFVLQQPRSYLRAWPEQKLAVEQQQRFQSLLEKRCNGYPIAYLTGTREFWSREFHITPEVLIPRPETELLVELCLDIIPHYAPLEVIDLGTGSGAIAITLAAERPALKITATDISPTALAIAMHNAQRLQVTHILFRQSDWFDNLSGSVFDMVISNPPYVAENDPHLQQGDLRFEPFNALISGDQGLQDIDILARSARHHLKTNGQILVEHGFAQQDLVQSIFTHYNYRNIKTHLDLSRQPRVTSAQWR